MYIGNLTEDGSMTIVLGNEGIKELRSYLELLKGNLASTVKNEDAIAERGKLYMMSFSPQVWVDGNIAGDRRH